MVKLLLVELLTLSSCLVGINKLIKKAHLVRKVQSNLGFNRNERSISTFSLTRIMKERMGEPLQLL